MTLKDLIEAVQEKNLTKSQLEAYRDDMSRLYSMMQLELSDIRKAKALYCYDNKLESVKATEQAWAVTQQGQREIELSHYSKACATMLSSLKSRIYQIY